MVTAAGLTYKVVGSGELVQKQLPESGAMVIDKGMVILYTEDNAKEQTTTVPSFVGYTPSQVNSLAAQYGLNVHFKGNLNTSKAVVSYQQSVAKDAVVGKGTVVEVYFRSNETGDIGAYVSFG